MSTTPRVSMGADVGAYMVMARNVERIGRMMSNACEVDDAGVLLYGVSLLDEMLSTKDRDMSDCTSMSEVLTLAIAHHWWDTGRLMQVMAVASGELVELDAANAGDTPPGAPLPPLADRVSVQASLPFEIELASWLLSRAHQPCFGQDAEVMTMREAIAAFLLRHTAELVARGGDVDRLLLWES